MAARPEDDFERVLEGSLKNGPRKGATYRKPFREGLALQAPTMLGCHSFTADSL